ncbi:unnamed protein product [Ilex paraguariensis]|uniref:Uncharacterized protein n=1 Tax=Ilex paraguariensis TaxID=185542 RepID=A0ABC8T4A0_9AQUA
MTLMVTDQKASIAALIESCELKLENVLRDQLSLIEPDNMLKAMRLGYCGIVRFQLIIPNGWKFLDKDEDVLGLGRWVNKHKVFDEYVEHTRGNVLDQSQAKSNCIPIAQQFDGRNNVGLYEEHSDNSTSDDEYFYDSEYDLDEVKLHDTMVDKDV